MGIGHCDRESRCVCQREIRSVIDYAKDVFPGNAQAGQQAVECSDLVSATLLEMLNTEFPTADAYCLGASTGNYCDVDADGHLLGIFTDGDLRRSFDRQVDVHATRMDEVMTRGGKAIGPKALAAEAVHLMEEHRITALPVVDADGILVGALNVHDLLRAGVM